MRAGKPSALQYFSKFQLGVGVSMGWCTVSRRKLNYYLKLATVLFYKLILPTLLFKVVNRCKMIEEVRKISPSIASLAEWSYWDKPLLLTNRGEYCHSGKDGPLGPHLFAIVLHDLILKIATECPGSDINLWYFDDLGLGFLMGNAADFYKAWTIISVYGPDFGLYVNVPKYVLFWPYNLQRLSYFSIFP
jgi:hypothetical protein